ncbi:hypothetical protein [Paenibacillus medicaginis]|uniref:HEPN domain-containing protein n=1 Tax=Paenibacillus medicaginis TaxID=1470560 RepID=A0ABV5C9K6_9BACL
MVNRGVAGNKHTFVRTFVNKVMFKEGQEISAGLAQMYNRAYMLRDLADYSFDESIPVTFEDAIEIAEFVPRFKDAVLKILQGSG